MEELLRRIRRIERLTENMSQGKFEASKRVAKAVKEISVSGGD